MKELENASARFHISRLEAIELSIKNEFEKAYKIQDDKIRQNVLETYDDRYYRTCYEVQSKFGIGFDVSGVDTNKVKKLISKPWASDNKTFSDRVWTKKNEMIDTLRSQLIRTCATGGNIQDAVNSMMSFVSKDVKNARYAATRLLQTETAFFSSVSEKKALKDLDVEQYEILATLDSKTSPICQEMDGQVFKTLEYEIGATAPPFHVNCRSTTCPHFDDEYGERVARDRAGNTYMVPSDMTYKEWREKQDEDIKRGATTSTNMGANSAPKDFRNLQKQGVKSNMDSNTNTDDSQIKYNDITDKWIEKTKHGSYAECESITINEKTYKVGDNGVTLNLNNRTDEIEIAQALSEKYGKDVIILPEISGSNVNIKTADLMVNGKLVEIKTLSASGPNTIKNAIKRAKGQANDIIINIGETKLTTDEILDTIQKQFNNPQCRHMEHCIIMKDGKVLKVFEQKKVGTAAILKYDVVPTVNNITTNSLKSQLKNEKKRGSFSHQNGVKGTSLQQNNTIKIDKSQLKNEKKDDILNMGGSRHKIIKNAKDIGIERIEYSKFINQPTEKQIIERLSGGDMTKGGSCASLAYAYIGNKAGYDVLDYRGGESCSYFSLPNVMRNLINSDGVVGWIEKNYNGFKAVDNILNNVKPNTEYMLGVGNHAAIIKKDDEGWKFLELQSKQKDKNVWNRLTLEKLKTRFKVKESKKNITGKVELEAKLIEIVSLYKSNVFAEMLNYINTNENEQQKGNEGYIK